MHALKLSLFVAVPLALFALVGSSAHAYFYQPQPYGGYQYYQQQYSNPYNYGYQDTVSSLIQAHLNFVSNFVYVPSYYQMSRSYYSPQNYYGGYGYNYGYGY